MLMKFVYITLSKDEAYSFYEKINPLLFLSDVVYPLLLSDIQKRSNILKQTCSEKLQVCVKALHYC